MLWETIILELTLWKVDILRVDITGVNIMGVDVLAPTHIKGTWTPQKGEEGMQLSK